VRLLILGGTVFLGRHLAAAALSAGHEVTLFHRGRSGPDLYPEADHRLGDRDADVSSLASGEWDAMVDLSTSLPSAVAATADILGDRVGHATFVSSISVYADHAIPGRDESAPVGELPEGAEQVLTPHTYGPLKALCEERTRAAWPDTSLVIRPGLLVGPFDPSGRFTHWPVRLAAGGELLAPGDPDRAVQCIDARDAADFLLHAAEGRLTGTMNLTGPVQRLSMGEMLAACAVAAGTDPVVTWMDEGFLLERGVAPWMELPLWVQPQFQGMLEVDIGRAVAAGLECRPLTDTARDTLAWVRATGGAPAAPDKPPVGLDPQRERELLEEWHAAGAASE
jgi:2'-hydroxyisoflavone reductase